MADHQEQPDQDIRVQAFLEWMNRNYCFEILGFDHPNKPTKQKFLPKDAVITDLGTQAGRKLLEGTIEAVVPVKNNLLPTPEDILPNYIQVFCTLLNISEGQWIDWFRRYENLQDSSLPFASGNSPPHWPKDTTDGKFLEKFSKEQWKFCVPELKKPLFDRYFHEDQVLPIISKKFLANGSTATLWKIKLHPSYNKLINEEEKKLLGNLADTFVLKSYAPSPGAKLFYSNKIQAFRKVDNARGNRKSNIIGFRGSFTRGDSYNLLLEYADQKTLEDYFKREPPTESEDIIRFWEELFEIVFAVNIIHEAIRGESQEFQGWHHDVKPENILVVSGGSQNIRDWKFKLVDPGTSHFKKNNNSAWISSVYRVQTYGSPECYRPKDTSLNDRLQSEEKEDVWSLGCIFSEAAHWIKGGSTGLKEYRQARLDETRQLPNFSEQGCFHDGVNPLKAVQESHLISRRSLQDEDFITNTVADSLLHRTLIPVENRLTVLQLWDHIVQILHNAKSDLNHYRELSTAITLPERINTTPVYRRLKYPPPRPSLGFRDRVGLPQIRERPINQSSSFGTPTSLFPTRDQIQSPESIMEDDENSDHTDYVEPPVLAHARRGSFGERASLYTKHYVKNLSEDENSSRQDPQKFEENIIQQSHDANFIYFPEDEESNRKDQQIVRDRIAEPDRNIEVLDEVHDSGYGTSIQERLTSKIDISSVYTGEAQVHIDSNDSSHSWDDTRSVVSVNDDIHSQASTRRTPHEVTAEKHLSLLLAQNKELKPLYEAALANIGKERLINNLRKILKQYYLELSSSAKTNLEKAAAQLLRSRWSRIRIAEQISHLVAPTNEEDLEQQLKDIDVHRPDLDAWIDNNAAFVPVGEVKTRANEVHDQDNQSEDDLERLIDDSSDEEEDTERKVSPRISEVEKFLVEGGPFHRLSANLLTFLLPSSLSSLTQELMTIPSERIWFSDEDDNSFLNKFKTVIENVTEEDWHWWPLRPKMRMLQEGQTRVHWRCHCGTHLWAEVSKPHGERYKSLLPLRGTYISHEHLCIPGQRSTLSVILRQCINRFVSAAPSSSSAAISSNIPLDNLNQENDQGLQQNITSMGSRSSTSQPSQNVAESNQQGAETSFFAGTNKELVVLFGVHGARRTLELAQIDALKYSNDSTFFHELRKTYKELRGWRYWLSIWQLKHCDFVKFDKIEADRILLNKKNDLPEDSKLYEYNPRPPNVDVPPISTHQFEYRLLRHCNTSCILSPFHDCVKPPAGEWALGRIPKRTHALELQTNEPDTAWGIQAQFRPHALLVFSYHLVPLAGGLAFWGWWQWTHPGDLQDASTPLIVVATFMALLWSSVSVLYLFR